MEKFRIVKENIENFKEIFREKDPDLMLKQELFSIQALNPFIIYNSSPRGLMMSSHVAQLIVLNNPEPNIIQTKIDSELAKYVISKKFTHDAEIIDVVKRYQGPSWSPKDVVEYTIIYRKLDDGEIDSITIPRFNKFHPYFGFIYKFLIDPDTMYRGQIFKKDTMIAVPPTITDKGDYAYGLNANVCMMTLPDVAEDGVIVSKSFCERMKFKIIEKRTLNVSRDEVLLNLYGDDENYKPFPDIGEEVNDNGILMATRKLDDDITLGLITTKELQRVNPLFDEVVYVRKGKVIDVKIYENRKNKLQPMQPDEFVRKYINGMFEYNRRLIDVYQYLKRENNGEVPVSNNFNRL